MKRSKLPLIILGCCFMLLSLSAQTTAEDKTFISHVRLIPGYGVFIGESADLFSPSFNGEFFLHHRLEDFPFLSFGSGIGYNQFTLVDGTNPTAILSGGIAAGVDFEIFNRTVLEALVWGGVYHGWLLEEGTRQTGLYITEAITLNYDISPSIRLGGGAAFRNYSNLSSDFNFFINFVYRFDYHLEDPVKIESAMAEPIYRDLSSRYNQGRPLLSLSVLNHSDIEITSLEAEMKGSIIEMDLENSQIPGGIDPLGVSVLFFAGDFKDVTPPLGEDEIQVDIEYRYKGWPIHKSLEIPLFIEDADFQTDPLALSVFVTQRDRTILNIADFCDITTRYKVIDNIDRGLQLALADYQMLQRLGLSVSTARTQEDLPDFPVDVLMKSMGNPQEVLLLYCSLLEAQGINSGYIITQEGMLAAVQLQITPGQAALHYSLSDQLYSQDGALWLPLDVSDLSLNFVDAISSGTEILSKVEDSQLYPLLSGRVQYGETGYSYPHQNWQIQDEAEFAEDFLTGMDDVVDWTVSGLEEDYRRRLSQSPRNVTLLNNLGVLLAENGRLEEAEDLFNQALLYSDDKSLYVNLGNIAYLDRSLESAALFFEKATRLDPFNPIVLLGQARINYELENYGVTVDSFNKLELIDADLASRYAYLNEKDPDEATLHEIELLRRQVYWLRK